jgi:phenylpyruvate tautomerase PptA (4-oxalocrotonate tautomerase family)
MPLVRIDAIEGRTKQQIKDLLDAAHRAVLSALGVPQRDRYQIYHEHQESHIILEDTGLGIPRTKKAIVVTLISMPRSQELKLKLYADLCAELKKSCDIDPSDVIVSIVTNSAPDWSFGNARAQFITGEL